MSICSQSNLIRRFALVAWVVALLASITMVYRAAAATPQVAPATREDPSSWPAKSRWQPTPGRTTVVIIAHPECPCTRATITNLLPVLRSSTRPVDTVLILAGPAVTTQPGSTERSLVDALAPTALLRDRDGREAALFGATTSGHVVVFDPRASRVFSGGTTPVRGHVGPCDALDRFTRATLADQPAPAPTAVRGCPLMGPGGPVCESRSTISESCPTH